MAELNPQQRAAITKRNNTRSAFLGTAAALFNEYDYPDIQVADVSRRSGISTATFYTMFTGKSAWAAAVLDARLNDTLDQQRAPEVVRVPTPRERVLGHLVLLGEVATPLPGITKALVDERAEAQVPYSDLLPRYYRDVTDAFRDGQERGVFRDDMVTTKMADLALDTVALACAVHLDDLATNAIVDGFSVRE